MSAQVLTEALMRNPWRRLLDDLKELSVSARGLAEALGIDDSLLWRYATGERTPTPDRARAAAEVLRSWGRELNGLADALEANEKAMSKRRQARGRR